MLHRNPLGVTTYQPIGLPKSDKVRAEEIRKATAKRKSQQVEPTPARPVSLAGLQRDVLLGMRGKSHVYQGTSPAGVVTNRRGRNRMAAASRRTNRGK